MRKLTKREIVLLYILGCLSVVLIGWMFLAKPALEKSSAARTKASEAESELMNLKISQAGLENVENDAKRLAQEIEGLLGQFSSNVDSEALDKQFTTLAQRYFLKPLDFTIKERVTVPIVSLEKRYELLESKEELPTTQEGKPKGTHCDVMYLTLRAAGTQANAASLAQEVSTYQHIRLNSMVVDNINHEVTFEFAIYFVTVED